jgi:Abortive infection C-terminus
MAKLSGIDKLKLEKLLGMGGGYVLDFSNRTFQDLVIESVGVDIYDDKYSLNSGSKANRLRAFWDQESPHLVAKLLEDLLEYYRYTTFQDGQYVSHETGAMLMDFEGVIEKLRRVPEGTELETFDLFSARRSFEELSISISRYISEGKPTLALDRLHTFITRYLRQLGEKYLFKTEQNIPLHSLLGAYIKAVKDSGTPLHEMSERILKTSISILESFNDVRNNASYAHDNEVLESAQSRLVVASISNLIRFIDSIENPVHKKSHSKVDDDIGDIPF